MRPSYRSRPGTVGQLGVGVYVHPVLDRGHDEVITGRKELVDGAEPDACPACHLAELYAVVAAGLEHLDHHVEDPYGRVRLWLGQVKTAFLL